MFMVALNPLKSTIARYRRPAMIGVAAAIATASLTACTEAETSETRSETLPGEGVSVTPAYATLEERFQTEILNIGLERLGYDVQEPKEIENAPMHVDIANGGIDFTAVHWENNQSTFFENSGGDEVLERVGVYIDNMRQGYMIDKATAEEYDITSIEQLQDPEIAALFDTDADGKANLVGCNTGWACESIIEHHLDIYGLSETVQQDTGKYFALIANTITRFEQGQPILYYVWTPLWVNGVLEPGEDVDWLPVPFTDLPDQQEDVTEADTTVDGVNIGFALERQLIVANQTFIDENPAAAEFFELAMLPVADVNAQNKLMYEGEDSEEDIRRHAEAWIEENQETFDQWVETARNRAS